MRSPLTSARKSLNIFTSDLCTERGREREGEREREVRGGGERGGGGKEKEERDTHRNLQALSPKASQAVQGFAVL